MAIGTQHRDARARLIELGALELRWRYWRERFVLRGGRRGRACRAPYSSASASPMVCPVENRAMENEVLAALQPEASTQEAWTAAVAVLRELLEAGDGCASSYALRAELERQGFEDARKLVLELRFYDFDSPPDDHRSHPGLRWHRHGKSFYSPERYSALLKQEAEEADQAEWTTVETAEHELDPAKEPEPERRRNRQEESRLGRYVLSALRGLYASEFAPAAADYVFDVHSDRGGGDLENVDLIAVHWRSAKTIELVTVEVKLEFSARLVQQARNYTRFSDRVWIAVPVEAEAGDAGSALREDDGLLFEHVVAAGLGVLACKRRRGRSYDVFPVHWPRRQNPDVHEKDVFIERYRSLLERALVVPSHRDGHTFPQLR
jgi:hypothetical protein